jgi:hypothetical protein
VVSTTLLGIASGAADDRWNPFAERDAAAKRRSPSAKAAAPNEQRPYLAPMRSAPGRATERQPVPDDDAPPGSGNGTFAPAGGPPRDAAGPATQAPVRSAVQTIERGDLAPVLAADGSGLPADLWQGVDLPRFEQLLTRLHLPPRSPALHSLWRRLVRSNALPQSADPGQFRALQAEALYRSGLLADVIERLEGAAPDTPQHPAATLVRSRAALGLGETEAACSATRTLVQRKAELPKPLRAEAFVLSGYCAAASGSAAGAGLAAELAREDGVDAPLSLAMLDALAAGDKPKLTTPKRIGIVDLRLLEQFSPVEPAMVVERAEPALLAALVLDRKTEPALRLAAAEAGLRLNVVQPVDLANIYRAQSFEAAALAEALTARTDPLKRRALLFQAAEAERTPQKKARLIRALLDDARRSSLYMQMLVVAAPLAQSVPRAQEISWFAETAIEIALATGKLDVARDWVRAVAQSHSGQFAGEQGPHGHWLALADIADPAQSTRRGASLASVESLALGGRYSPDMLHRLATVLDSLDYNVPIPLWDAANRTPQPSGGHLPETGVLPELVEAAKAKAFGRTVLLVMATLGPNGAEGAHMIALGDAIRALKRAGLEAEARRIGFEALFAGWPRTSTP